MSFLSWWGSCALCYHVLAAPHREPHVEPVEERAHQAARHADEEEDGHLGERVRVGLRELAEGDQPRVPESLSITWCVGLKGGERLDCTFHDWSLHSLHSVGEGWGWGQGRSLRLGQELGVELGLVLGAKGRLKPREEASFLQYY